MKRREFIAGLGSAAVLPLAARAQRRIRVVGGLSQGTPEANQTGDRIADPHDR